MRRAAARPPLSAIGGDGDIGLLIASKGTAAITAQTGGGTQMQVLHQANAVSSMQLFGSPTGAPGRVGWQAAGSDANISAVIGQPKGSGALLAQVPDSGITGGNQRGANAVDLQMVRAAATQVASGSNAFQAGGFNVSSGTHSASLGGFNISAGTYSMALGGGCSAQGYAGTALGLLSNDRAQYGTLVLAAGAITASGDAQVMLRVLRRQTTDATSTRLTQDGGAAGSVNSLNLPSFGRSAGMLVVVAGAAGGTDSATWRINLSAARGNGAGTVVVFEGAGASIAPTASQGGGSAWRLAVAADPTNGGIAVSGTGAAGVSINWVGRFSDTQTVLSS